MVMYCILYISYQGVLYTPGCGCFYGEKLNQYQLQFAMLIIAVTDLFSGLRSCKLCLVYVLASILLVVRRLYEDERN